MNTDVRALSALSLGAGAVRVRRSGWIAGGPDGASDWASRGDGEATDRAQTIANLSENPKKLQSAPGVVHAAHPLSRMASRMERILNATGLR